MQQPPLLAALLVALCSGHAVAGGSASGNSTRAANYTSLAAQLSALRLANSSHATVNNTGQGYNRSLHPVSAGLPLRRLQAQEHNKKAAGVVYGKKGKASQAAKQAASSLPSQQRHSSDLPPRLQATENSRSAGSRSGKLNMATGQQTIGNQTCNRTDSSASRPQALYRQNHRGYVLETRRQRKRRMAQEGDSTPLYSSNFTHINSDCNGYYRLAENIHLKKVADQLPLCNSTGFGGSLKGDGHTLSAYGSQPLFDTLKNAEIDAPMHCCGYPGTSPDREASTSLLANRLSGHNMISLSSGWLTIGDDSPSGRAVVGFADLIKDGRHTLQQTNAMLDITKKDFAGGAVNLIQGGITTLTQTVCRIAFFNWHPSPAKNSSVVGGGVAQLTGGKLILSQTDLFIRESEETLEKSLAGSGIGAISGESSAVLTQTFVRALLHKASHGPIKNRGSTFGSLAKNATLTLRLFSGYSFGHTCGSIEPDPAVTIRGVIDTASYSANSTSCKTDNHNHTALKLLDTTLPVQWRQAHEEFCCSQFESSLHISCAPNPASCHYAHEQLLATVPMGENSVLLLSRQHHLHAANDGLLRISRLLLSHPNASHSTAELDRSFGSKGILLFKPGEYHWPLQPGHGLVRQALANEHSLTLLCRTAITPYQLGTLSLRSDPGNNATVVMQPLKGLKGEPVLLSWDHSGQGCHLWTHEQQNQTIYRYSLTEGCGLPVGNPHALRSEGRLIAMGRHNDTIYIASCNQTDNVVLQSVDPATGQLSEPTPVARLTPSERPDDTLVSNGDTLILIPSNTVLLQEGDKPPQALQVSLPWHGGTAHWRVSREDGQLGDEKTCQRVTVPGNKPTRPKGESPREPHYEL